jgi:hypothetical protein
MNGVFTAFGGSAIVLNFGWAVATGRTDMLSREGLS